MVDNQIKKQILDRILHSPVFHNKQSYQDLLTFIVNASIEGRELKETIIALEVFDRDKNFNPAEDTTVRYHIHKLRQKLESYYQSEGKDDKIELSIPKGHYEVIFSKVTKKDTRYFKNWFNLHHLKFFVIIIVFISIIIYQWMDNKSTLKFYQVINKNDPIWNDLFVHKSPTLIVLGDPFVFREYRNDLNRFQQIIDFDIKTEEDFSNYLEKHNIQRAWIPDIGLYIETQSAFNLMNLLPILNYAQKKPNIKLSSNLTWEDIKNNDIIYLGNFGQLRLLNKLIANLNVKYQLVADDGDENQKKIFITSSEGDTTQTFERYRPLIERGRLPDNYYNRSYAHVIKLPGPQNNSIFIFTGFGHVALIESVKMLTNPDGLKHLENLMQSNNKTPAFFELLFEIKGFNRTGLKTELKYFRGIDPDSDKLYSIIN